MTHAEVKKVLNDYFDENLSVEVDLETQNHISECSECSQYLYSLQDLMKKVEKLPRSLKPQSDYWQDIFHEISSIKSENIKQQEELELKEAEQQVKEEKTEELLKQQQKTEAEKLLNWERKKAEYLEKLKKPQVRNTLFGVLALAIVYIVYSTFLSKGASWDFNKFRIGSSTAEKIGELSENDIIETDAISRIEIHLPDAGTISLEPNSKIQRLPANKIQLISGILSANKNGASKLLTLVVPGAEIKDYFLGGQFSLAVNEDNITTLNVYDGWTTIVKNDLETLLLPNHTCRIIPDSGVGLPYLNTSTGIFVEAINNYCFTNPNNEEALISVLTKAELNNSVTLWNLMKRVTRKQRDMVIYTMFGLLGDPPFGVTDEGLRTLNSEMMTKLIEEIEVKI